MGTSLPFNELRNNYVETPQVSIIAVEISMAMVPNRRVTRHNALTPFGEKALLWSPWRSQRAKQVDWS